MRLNVFIWNIKENEVWHICISSFSVLEKIQKLLSVNAETKRHLGIKFQTWHHLHKYAFKGIGFSWMTPCRGAKFDGVRYAI